MEIKNQDNKNTQTITIEKDKQSQTKTDAEPIVHTFPSINLFSSDSLTKKEPDIVVNNENKDKKLEKLKQQIMENQREKQKKQQLEKQNEQGVAETEKSSEEEVEKTIDSLYDSSLIISPFDNELNAEEIDNLTNVSQKSYKFRFRLLTGVFCCIMAILVGWIIGNSIEIATTSNQIVTETANQQEYNVNIAEYMSKISRLDNDTSQSPDDDSLLPIDEIITITPQPLEDPTEYEEESNWFDSICNWLRNLFGG